MSVRSRVCLVVACVLAILGFASCLHVLVPPRVGAVRVGDSGQGQPTVEQGQACPGRVVFDQFTDQWYCD